MTTKSSVSKPIELGAGGTVALVLLLAGLRLSELMPLTAVPGASSQNWRVEFALAVFLVICSIWLLNNWSRAAAKLAFIPDRFIQITFVSLLAFTLWSFLSVFWAASAAAVILHTLTWLSYIAVLVYSLILLRVKGGLNTVVMALLVTAAVTALISLYDYAIVSDPSREIGFIRIRYARFAECFVTVSPLMCVWALYVRKKPVKYAALSGWLLAWLVVMLSTSKGAFLAGIIGHVVLFAGCIILTRYPIRKKMAAFAGMWLAFTLATQIALAAFSPLPTATEYISGEADPTRETSLMRLFTWNVGLEMALSNPITGVGANNFGIAFNDARVEYFTNRNETKPDVAEWYLVERAHNEFLQIVAELGAVGALLFAMVFLSFGAAVLGRFFAGRYTLPPLLWASIAGMTAFFASSFVSSFSFRTAQNGVFFFIVFALGINELLKIRRSWAPIPGKWPQLLLALSVVGSIGMMLQGGAKAYSHYSIRKAGSIKGIGRALPEYERAIQFDPDNFHLYQHVAGLFANEGRHREAARDMQRMIDRGGGTTLNYSVLADSHERAGQLDLAERALTEAVAIYPTSVFMRVRYAAFLKDRGRQSEADMQLDQARQLDPAQANGWYIFLAPKTAGEQLIPPGAPIVDLLELLPENARSFYMREKERKRDGSRIGER